MGSAREPGFSQVYGRHFQLGCAWAKRAALRVGSELEVPEALIQGSITTREVFPTGTGVGEGWWLFRVNILKILFSVFAYVTCCSTPSVLF